MRDPTRADLDALEEELAVLELASSRPVQVPKAAPTLRELLESLSAQSGIMVDADWDGLIRADIAPDHAPPVTQGDGSLLAVLEALCTSLGHPLDRPRPEAVLGHLRIVSSQAAASLRRARVYRADAIAAEFVDLATEHIDPEGWVRNGGEVQHVSVVDGAVIVSAPASTHRRLARLLDELRASRPAAVEFSIDILSVPGEPFRTWAMEASTGTEHASAQDLEGIRGASRLAAPTLVAAMEQQATALLEHGGWTIELSLRPMISDRGGTLVDYSLSAEREGVSIRLSGSTPLTFGGEPATLAFEEGLVDAVIVLRLRGRPLPRLSSQPAQVPSRSQGPPAGGLDAP